MKGITYYMIGFSSLKTTVHRLVGKRHRVIHQLDLPFTLFCFFSSEKRLRLDGLRFLEGIADRYGKKKTRTSFHPFSPSPKRIINT
ncbi:hypothetical protein HOLleu_36875 [Holothuria leucospilota]|uniref:Uncharacterized protein n=1 Tax=Holothuria leucospilota TaxID=206669 RepID=A0A9Q1BGX7_HOLLE|nr:hypothetical protein HOLleu_36875 [Holothuria leucospilota]